MALADAALPTLFEYYTGGGVVSGLSDKQPYFMLNEKNITIYSGAFHYFRVPRANWRDRLRKMRSAGLNTVETYVPWNLHEYQSGVYDFGKGGSEMEDFLHLEEFLKTAQEEDLFALVRPGPYICAEWDFGGLPSWILRNTSSVRNSKDENYLSIVKRYFNTLFAILTLLQFQKGGPIIGFQIENEYGNTGNEDTDYLLQLKQMYLDNGIVELLYTSDSPGVNGRGSIPDILQTANFNVFPKSQLDTLNSLQTNKPTMTMEYWTGWFDYWLDNHHTVSTETFKERFEEILDYPSSVNMYMFVGSTNFGFLNGANSLKAGDDNSGLLPATSSYDYDAPLTEYGDYTPKYTVVKEAIAARNLVQTKIPDPPQSASRKAYETLAVEKELYLSTVLKNVKETFTSEDVIPMELLPMNNDSGQSFGYIVYRKTNINIPANAELKISGYVRDTVLVLINGDLINSAPKESKDIEGFGFWKLKDSTLSLTDIEIKAATLDIVVENFGRNNFGILSQFRQFKGLTEPVYINDNKITDWELIPLEFKKQDNLNLLGWQLKTDDGRTPALYKSTLTIEDDPQDTFIDMRDWYKGIVIVNGFVIGRHFYLGPQQSLYIPAPLLIKGKNDIVIFEHFNAPDSVKFSDSPIFGGPSH